MRSDVKDAGAQEVNTPAWVAVFSLAMGVFGLLTAEYLPASLLTPMAADLGVSEALAGQAVTVTAVVALFAGLLVPRLTRGFDRRLVLLGFTVLMIASNLLVAFSSSLPMCWRCESFWALPWVVSGAWRLRLRCAWFRLG